MSKTFHGRDTMMHFRVHRDTEKNTSAVRDTGVSRHNGGPTPRYDSAVMVRELSGGP